MANIALIYNFAQHYRTNLFMLLDQQLDIDFYFGDHYLDVKKMDYSLLNHPVKELKNKWLGPLGWQSGAIGTAFKGYDNYMIIGQPMVLSSWLTAIIARIRGKKVFFWCHGWYGKEGTISKCTKKAFYKLANKIFIYGDYARSLMINEGINGAKIVTIHNSLMYDKQIEVRKSLVTNPVYTNHFGNNLPIIIFIGRLTTVKRLDMVLKSLSINLKNSMAYNVVFIGDGAERENLEKLTTKLLLDNFVWFYGPSYDENELSSLIYNADLCVAPGNIGLTAMHAMAYGCPCISHNDFKWQMPEFEAIQEGITGTFFERDNVQDLAASISRWLNYADVKREDIRQACFNEIDEKWNPHIQVKIFKEAIGL